MKNFTLPLSFLFVFVMNSFAQQAINVALIPVQAKPNTLAHNFNTAVANIAAQCLAKNKRIRTVERQNIKAVAQEINAQSLEVFNQNSTVEQFQLIGANYLMKTEVLDCSINKAYNKNEEGAKTSFAGYQVKINVSMSIIDVETGETLASKTAPSISYVQSDLSTASSEAIKGITKNLEKLIKEAFPLELTHRKISQKNNKAREIILQGGSELGIKKGDRLEVFVIDETGFEQQVGVVRIKAMNGPKFCTAVPTQKAKNILKHAYNQNTQMVFRSCNRESFMAGLDGFSKSMESTTYSMVSQGTIKF